jgi:hypothetical protein
MNEMRPSGVVGASNLISVMSTSLVFLNIYLPCAYVHLYLFLGKYAANVKVRTVLSSIPASPDTVESDGRQMMQ